MPFHKYSSARKPLFPIFSASLLSPLKTKIPFLHSIAYEKAYPDASLTVESAFVLPLFFLAVVSLIASINMFGRYSETSLMLSNEARTIAMYGSVSGEYAPEWIDLMDTVEYQSPVRFLPLPAIRVPVRARVRTWNGADISEDAEPSAANSAMVYVTEEKSVYHTHADCSHLNLAIIRTTTEEVGSLRNSSGKKYRKCAGFPEGYTGTVYVTEDGEYYYPSTDYGSLTRHVRLVPESEAAGLKECERCAAADQQ